MKDIKGVAVFLLMTVLFIRAHMSGIAYPFGQGLLLIPALVGLALILITPPEGLNHEMRLKEWAFILPWILCAWSFTSILWSADKGRGLGESLALFLNVTVFSLIYLLWRRENTSGKSWIAGFWLLLASIILRGAYQYHLGLDRVRNLLREMEASGQDVVNLARILSDDRIFAGFLNPNMMAGFLAISIPVTLDLALTSDTNKGQLTLGSLLAGQVWILILTGSVGGSLATAGAAGAVLLVRRGIRGRDLLWMGSVCLVILAGLIMMRGFDLSFGPDNSLIQRLGYIKAGIAMAIQKPLLGWGAGSGPGALMGFVPVGVRPVTDPHNFLIRSWISLGIPGMGILIAFLALWIRKVFWPILRTGRERNAGAATGFAFGALAFLAHSLIDMDFFVPETAMFGWAAMGICLVSAPGVGDKEPTEPAFPGSPGLKFFGGAALFLVLPVLVYTQGEITAFRADRHMEDGRPVEAAEMFKEAGKLLPFNGRFILEEGRSRRSAGQFEKADGPLRRASRLLPYSPYPRWELGRLAMEQEQWEEAIPFLVEALKRYPSSPRIRLDLAQVYNQLGRYEETLKLLQEVERISVFDPEAGAVARKALEVPASEADTEPMEAY